MKRGIKLKKILSIILCVLMSFSFVACNNNTNSVSSDNINESASVNDTDTPENSSSITSSSNNQNSKNITRLYITYSGIQMDITSDKNSIAELSELEKEATVPETNLSTKFADITAVYDDNTEDIYGSIYIGDDGGYYLKFANSEVEGAAYKMTDSSFVNELF